MQAPILSQEHNRTKVLIVLDASLFLFEPFNRQIYIGVDLPTTFPIFINKICSTHLTHQYFASDETFMCVPWISWHSKEEENIELFEQLDLRKMVGDGC